MNLRFHRHLALALLLAGSAAQAGHAADTPSGEEFSTAYPNPAPGYDAPGTYSNDPYAQPQQPAPPAAARGWSGQSTAPSNGYGASGSGYGSGYGSSQAYGSGQAGGIQGGSFAGRGQTQGAGTANPYSSGKTFTKPPKTNVDPSAFGGGANGSNGWPQQNTETPAPTPY
ncbi:hypothetical protein [Nevskia sp.]|uniref:hypothetical protein n=1 Tax=Nevskia sp. TaxID=1929292 RepID=UPI0025FE821C|nr:hypothetical protein [Nevskia sp.]